MDIEKNPEISKLSATQIETLQHVLLHRSSKEIGRIMSVSPHTVDERIRRAIRILGVTTRVEAARLIAKNGDQMAYQPLIYQSPQLGSNAIEHHAEVVPAQTGPGSFLPIGYPFPTRNRPRNTHGRRERILWPVLIAFGTIMAFAALYTVLLGLGEMLS